MAVKLEAMKQLVYSAAEDTSWDGFPSPMSSSAAKIMAAEMAESARIKAESEAAATRLAEAKEKHTSLNSELNAAMKEYSASLRNAKTREARTAAMDANPIKELT